MTTSVAFVTVSYRLDRDRCALLNRSLEACAPSFEHWIVVDRGDLPLFRSLQSNRTHVVAKEEVLPVWIHRVDTLKIGLRSNAWLQARGVPIRGWLLQQLVKLAMAERLSADVLVHADSDVVFLQPFSEASVVDEAGNVRLYARPDAVDEHLPELLRWHRSAEKLLCVDPADVPMQDFISALVPWKRQNAVALLEHVERTTGKHWLRALASAWDVSEYILYGRFVEDVLGRSSGQYVSATPLCLDYYSRVPLTEPELTAFLGRFERDMVAVSLSSKAGMSPADYVDVLERQWASPVPQEHDAEAPVGDAPALPRATPAPAGVTGTESPRAGPARAPARRATARRAGPLLGRLEQVARSGMAAALLGVLAMMVLLFGLGLD